ncbi:unnamed protein product, partial [Musa acuminata subsp. burmannicoides]
MRAPPTMNRSLRPQRSTRKVETRTDVTLTTPRMTAFIRAASLPNPIVRNKTGEKNATTTIPICYCNIGIATAITRYGWYRRRTILPNAPSSWLVKPMPTPSSRRPTMRISTFTAAAAST